MKISRTVQSVERYINRWVQFMDNLDPGSAKAETTAYDPIQNDGTDEILSRGAPVIELLAEQKSTVQFIAQEKVALSQKQPSSNFCQMNRRRRSSKNLLVSVPTGKSSIKVSKWSLIHCHTHFI